MASCVASLLSCFVPISLHTFSYAHILSLEMMKSLCFSTMNGFSLTMSNNIASTALFPIQSVPRNEQSQSPFAFRMESSLSCLLPPVQPSSQVTSTPLYHRNDRSYRKKRLNHRRRSTSTPASLIEKSHPRTSARNIRLSLKTPESLPESPFEFSYNTAIDSPSSSQQNLLLQRPSDNPPLTPPSTQPSTLLLVNTTIMPTAHFSCGHPSFTTLPFLPVHQSYPIPCRSCSLTTLRTRITAIYANSRGPITDLVARIEEAKRRLWRQWDAQLGAMCERAKADLRGMVGRRNAEIRAAKEGFESYFGGLALGEVPTESREEKVRLEFAMVRVNPA